MDRINHLPDDVMDRILCLLPLLEVVKTSVLARSWRYKWVTLSKMILDCQFWQHIPDNKMVEVYTTILLKHQGALHELYLDVPCFLNGKREVLSSPIQFALRKGVTRLTLENYPVKLPSCIYSSAQLTNLEIKLHDCAFSPPAWFCGLPNLVSFTLHRNSLVDKGEEYENLRGHPIKSDEADKIMNFISRCPNIQKISLYVAIDKDLHINAPKLEYLTVSGDISCIYLEESQNLRYLNLGLESPEKCCAISFNDLVQLEHLKLQGRFIQLSASSEVSHDSLGIADELRGLLCVFASSPNLRTLSICLTVYDIFWTDEMEIDSYMDLYRDLKFENLQTVEIYTYGFKISMKMIELLLGCSVCLELMSIRFYCKDIVEVFKEVAGFARASPKATLKFF